LEKELTLNLQAKKDVQEIEEKYLPLLDNSYEGIAVNQNGWCRFVNPRMTQILGYSETELKSKPLNQFIHPNDRDWVLERHSKRLKGDSVPDDATVRVLAKSGEIKWLQMKLVSIKWEEEPAVLALVLDVTERKRAEESEEKYRVLFDNTGTATAIVEKNGIISAVNKKFEQFTGYSKDEVEGTKLAGTLIAEEEHDRVVKYFRRRRRGEKDVPTEYDCKMLTRNGVIRDIFIQVGIIPSSGQFIASFMDITARKREEEAIREREEFLREENIRLRLSIKERYRFGDIVGRSEPMQKVYELILHAASTEANVVIYGESGTGKELVAKAIHKMSKRSKNNFVPVNCAAIPENIIESEFFGHRKGAFTGAYTDKEGYIDLAEGGTLFLDEIDAMSLNMQVKLLRAIDGGGYTPVGTAQSKKGNFRILSTSKKDLRDLITRGLFREDFYYRIHILPIHLPPLRDREEDIPLLAQHFMEEYGDGNRTAYIPANLLEQLTNYDWPGNVRELQNTVRRYLAVRHMDFIDISKPADLANDVCQELGEIRHQLHFAAEEFEKRYICLLLNENRWRLGKVASILGINRRTLSRKIAKHGIEKT
jgi:PAS domain S-box-containing protein